MEKTQCIKCCTLNVKGKEIDFAEEVEKINHFIVSMEREQLKVHGLTITQCKCILKLNRSNSLTMNDISEYMKLEKSTMTRIIDKLAHKGYIVREKSKKDKRITYVRLSETGQQTAIHLRNMFGEYYTRVLSNIPYKKIDIVIESLFIFLEAMKKAKEYIPKNDF